MRIATWNVNSIRARCEHVVDLLDKHDIDVLCVQETKCRTDQFPSMVFADKGYEYAHVGYNQWNGVAILSRLGLEDCQDHFPHQPGFAKDPQAEQLREARAISARVGQIRLWSMYVPHGRSLTDRHMSYKLQWLQGLQQDVRQWLEEDPGAQIFMGGDWNVAPLDTDVWDPGLFEGATHVSPQERAALSGLEDAGMVEISRQFLPEPHTYTYWDYRLGRLWKNEGMRIDFGYCSPTLAQRVRGVNIDLKERQRRGSSDHAAIIIDVEDTPTA